MDNKKKFHEKPVFLQIILLYIWGVLGCIAICFFCVAFEANNDVFVILCRFFISTYIYSIMFYYAKKIKNKKVRFLSISVVLLFLLISLGIVIYFLSL